MTKSVQALLPSIRGGCSKGASFMSRIQVHGKGPGNYNVQPRLVRGGLTGGVWGRSNLPKKSSTVVSEPNFGPSNQKFLDPPLFPLNLSNRLYLHYIRDSVGGPVI